MAKHMLERDKYAYGHCSTGACRLVLPSHDTFGPPGPSSGACGQIIETADFTATSSEGCGQGTCLDNAMCGLPTTLCPVPWARVKLGTSQVRTSVPLSARLDGHPVLAVVPVPADGLGPCGDLNRYRLAAVAV